MRIMLLGTPGSGKGTLANRLSKKIQIPHISTGDIFRAAIRQETDLGLQVKAVLASGKLVSDELTCAIVFDRLQQSDAQHGFILDGFPRTIPQVKALEQQLSLDAVILLELDQQTNIRRLTERLICPDCGAIYHLTFFPPEQEGLCDQCGAVPVQRPDDRMEVVNERLAAYRQLTAPLIRHYDQGQKIRRFNAEQGPDLLLNSVLAYLQGL